jgi:hypothetical protein
MSYDIQGFFDEQQCSGQLLLNGRRQRFVGQGKRKKMLVKMC